MMKYSKYPILIVLIAFSFVINSSSALAYREIPAEPIQDVAVPEKLVALQAQWNETLKYRVVTENQPQLERLSQALSKYVNKYNGTLLYIVRYSNDPAQRSQAAELLSWSSNPKNINFILEWDLMNDPVDSVRHHLVRTVSSQLNTINDKSILRKTIYAFCQQTTLPSDIDRNKALFLLQRILSKHQDLTNSLHDECRSSISYISQTTILPNVSVVAKDILYLAANPKK